MARRRWTAANIVIEQIAWTAITFTGTSIAVAFVDVAEFGLVAVAGSIVLLAQAVLRTQFAEPVTLAVVGNLSRIRLVRATAVRQIMWRVWPIAVVGASVLPLILRDFALLAVAVCAAVAMVGIADVNRGSLAIEARRGVSAAIALIGLSAQVLVSSVGFYLLEDPATFIFGWATALAIYSAGCAIFRRNEAREFRASGDSWLAEAQRRGRLPFFIETVFTVGVSQGGIILLASVAGLEASAAVRAALLLFFPVSMVVQSATQGLVPRVAPWLALRHGLRRAALITAGCVLGLLAYTFVLSTVRPLAHILLRDSIDIAYQVLWGVGLFIAGSVSLVIPLALARGSGALRYGPILRAIQAPWGFAGATVLYVFYGGLAMVQVGYAVTGSVSVVGAAVILILLNRRLTGGEARV